MTFTDADTMPPRITAPANLPELVRAAFNKARASGHVNFYPTQVTLVDVNSIPFQLRFSPSLANKPKGPKPVGLIDHRVPSPPSTTSVGTVSPAPIKDGGGLEPPKKKLIFDPFDNPLPSMLITPLPPHHILVLNKFAIVPEHFILTTKEYKEQTHLLEQSDLEATRACIQAYEQYAAAGGTQGEEEEEEEEEEGQDPKLYAFFNCGEHSGASQPHRHLQLLVVERMREGLEGVETEQANGGRRWEVLAQQLVEEGKETSQKLPFKTFAERLTPDMTGEELHAVYLGLYRRARDAVRRYQSSHSSSPPSPAQQPPQTHHQSNGADEIQTGGEASISYNLAMTRDVMVIIPRLAEGAAIVERKLGGNGEEAGEEEEEVVVGKLALNGTVLAGTALVKSQREWDALRRNPERVGELLGVIGMPSNNCEEGEK
ncbi:ATP adenylyltransferase-domain-containing protein [Pseudoneurospora amorphoporcata]|uniref:ATP adenylyltransferase-domain-containing protein n=1 Tax=Pseudoneurospora amorphoporcata TaxID=241081 RepID=A0AAN6SH24_9PEZI|nr:ATP adenylyltransferase-domain-containing protein [Pseudoneurospora amorphoporcata]